MVIGLEALFMILQYLLTAVNKSFNASCQKPNILLSLSVKENLSSLGEGFYTQKVHCLSFSV